VNWRLLRKIASALLAFCIVQLWPVAHAQESHPAHWSYEGTNGPKNWGQLDPAYATCAAGHAQSPIDIKDASLVDLPPLKFDYNSVPLSIINNGHTIQLDYAPGSSLKVGEKTYVLRQFHFHHPGEEHLNGRGFDFVAHLVHDDGNGHLAVVAILFETGASNALLDAVWRNIPARAERATNEQSVSLNARDLLPPDYGYYTFGGSLTTPPCSEGVTWYVLKSQSTLSANQLAAFAKLYPNNARPIQPLYGREILETK